MLKNKYNSFSVITLVIVLLGVVIITLLAYPGKSSKKNDDVLGMSLPATGVWNGFNRHLIVLECSNLKNAGVTLGLTIKNQGNAVIGSEDFSLSGQQSEHIILNKYDVNDAYGTFELQVQAGSDPAVSCQTITYRMDASSRVQYATASDIGELIEGNSSGVFNSMNPDQTVSNPVYNWLSVYNPGSDDFSAVVHVRDQSGAPLPDRDIRIDKIPSGGRRDFALGHPDGQVVGVYEILPDNGLAKYGAFLSRYSETAPGEFSFSMIIPASKGVIDSGIVPASTMGPAFNWAELANISSQTVSAELEVFDRSGDLLFKTEKTLEPYAQYHEFLNRHVGELNVGFFRVRSSAPLLVQSFYYGRDEAKADQIFWAYNTMGSGKFYRDVSFAVNTNLNAPNWLKIFAFTDPHSESETESESAEVTVELTLLDNKGEEISLGDDKYVRIVGSEDIPIHEFAGSDFVGSLRVNTQTDDAFIQAQMVRVLAEDQVGERSSVMRAKSMIEISGRKGRSSLIGTIIPVIGQVTSASRWWGWWPWSTPTPTPTPFPRLEDANCGGCPEGEECRAQLLKEPDIMKWLCCDKSRSRCGLDRPCGCPLEWSEEEQRIVDNMECRKIFGFSDTIDLCCHKNAGPTKCGADNLCGCLPGQTCKTMTVEPYKKECCPDNATPCGQKICGCNPKTHECIDNKCVEKDDFEEPVTEPTRYGTSLE
jgi:hypothetical protein